MLTVENLSIDLGQFALRNVDLHVPEGDFFCLLGPTGAGKTILLECICGLLTPREGLVSVGGVDMTRRPPEVRGIGYVPQDFALFPHMTVGANIAYGLVEHGLPRTTIEAKVSEVAALLRIDSLLGRTPRHLSGGERQRVALARALVMDCRLLLLDEPFGAVDQLTKQDLFPFVTDIHERMGLTIVHVTHDFTEAHALAARVGVIHQGRLLQTGAVEEVFARPTTHTVARFVGLRNLWASDDPSVEVCPLRRGVTAATCGSATERRWLCIPSGALRASASEELAADFVARGCLRKSRWLGSVHELIVDTGAPLVVTLGAREYERLRCDVGQALHVGVDAEDIHSMRDA
jgi:ABC-type Fe3+/spermidine/putrescine transport system ATPase subunit